MNKAISEHFKKLGKAGGKKSWEVRKKKILEGQKPRKVVRESPPKKQGSKTKMKVFISILFTLGTIGFIGYSVYIYNFKYELVIGSYVENAYEVNTPERMIAEIGKAVKGMESENL